MATEVLASDVLCEAMEYLSKLGSNLKTRTDRLKEKKIRKDKLKNLHSVHKAANKVLLICELSKKSLENVEKGVRKILSKVETTQVTSSVGGNDRPNGDSKRTEMFQQFEYCSRKLRICKTVPIKHYMSVKVRARNMSLSMQEKYPVYYDCKLYRIRKNKLKKSVEQLQIGMEIQTPDIHVVTQNEDSCINKGGNTNKLSLISSNEHMSKNNTAELAKKEDINTESSSDTVASTLVVNVSDTLLPELVEEDTNTGNIPARQNSQSVNEEIFEKEDTDSTSTKSRPCKSAKTSNEEIVSNASGESESSDNQHRNDIKNTRIKKHKFSRILNDSSDDNENVQDNDPKTKLSTEVCTVEKKALSTNSKFSPKKRKMSVIVSDEDTSHDTDQKLLDINEQPAKETNKICDDKERSIEVITPQIKCVNIFKLLKPDIVDNLHNKPEISNTSKTHSRDITYKNRKTTNSQMRQIKSTEMYKQKQFLNRKRKGVLAFRSKKFVIKVQKLPSISKELLQKYKLKRITQNGSVVCQLDDEVLEQSDKEKKNLSDDSDSGDVIPKRPSVDGKKLKLALLCDSDSDNQANNNKSYNKSDECKDVEDTENQVTNNENNKLPNEDISNSGKQKKSMTEINNKEVNSLENNSTESIKNSLLNDSDADVSDIEMNTLISEDILQSSNENNINKGDTIIEEDQSCINQISLNNEKFPDNNTCESSDNNVLGKGLTLVNNSVNNTDVRIKSHNDPEGIEKLKNSLLRESDSDNHDSADNIGNENDSETRGHEVSKITKDTDIENPTNSLIDHSDSDNEQANKLTVDDSNLGEIESNSKLAQINSFSDGKADSNVNENEISPNKIKSSLLNSSDDSHSDNKKSKLEPKLRRKRIRESIKARKMLLTRSSSSDDDVQSKERSRDNMSIDNFISEIVHDIEDITRENKRTGSTSSSGSSDENILRKAKKKKRHENSEQCETKTQEKNVEDSSGIEDSQNIDEKCQEHSDSSSSQV